jgi:hypothetical protein
MKIVQSFFLGILGAIGALILEIVALSFLTPISSTSETISREISSLGYLFFIAIIIEEFLKYILIIKVISKISEKKNVVLNSLFLGFGFSMLELFSFYWNYRSGIDFDLLAIIGIIIVHASTAVIIGFSALKNFLPSLFFGFFASFVIHLAYNTLGASEHPYQKQLIVGLLGILIILVFFLLIKSIITDNKEKIS